MRPKRKLARKQRITEIFAVFGTMALFSGLQNYLNTCFAKPTKSLIFAILPSRGDRRLTLKHDHCQWDLTELESLSVGGSLQANQCISFEHWNICGRINACHWISCSSTSLLSWGIHSVSLFRVSPAPSNLHCGHSQGSPPTGRQCWSSQDFLFLDQQNRSWIKQACLWVCWIKCESLATGAFENGQKSFSIFSIILHRGKSPSPRTSMNCTNTRSSILFLIVQYW